MARPSPERSGLALPALWYAPRRLAHCSGPPLIQFYREIDDMNKVGKRLWGKRGRFFWGNQFQKKIELGDAQSCKMPPPLGTPEHTALARARQSALTINSTTSSLLYYTIQTQFLLATKSAAVTTRA